MHIYTGRYPADDEQLSCHELAELALGMSMLCFLAQALGAQQPTFNLTSLIPPATSGVPAPSRSHNLCRMFAITQWLRDCGELRISPKGRKKRRGCTRKMQVRLLNQKTRTLNSVLLIIVL